MVSPLWNDQPWAQDDLREPRYTLVAVNSARCIEDGRALGQGFFPWYNQDHRHSGLGFLTSAVVHFGQAATVRAQRQQVLAVTYTAHPERFVNGRPHPADLPTAVWINPPPKKATAADGPGTTTVTEDDPPAALMLDVDDHAAFMGIDRNATLITSTLVSQCH